MDRRVSEVSEIPKQVVFKVMFIRVPKLPRKPHSKPIFPRRITKCDSHAAEQPKVGASVRDVLFKLTDGCFEDQLLRVALPRFQFMPNGLSPHILNSVAMIPAAAVYCELLLLPNYQFTQRRFQTVNSCQICRKDPVTRVGKLRGEPHSLIQ